MTFASDASLSLALRRIVLILSLLSLMSFVTSVQGCRNTTAWEKSIQVQKKAYHLYQTGDYARSAHMYVQSAPLARDSILRHLEVYRWAASGFDNARDPDKEWHALQRVIVVANQVSDTTSDPVLRRKADSLKKEAAMSQWHVEQACRTRDSLACGNVPLFPSRNDIKPFRANMWFYIGALAVLCIIVLLFTQGSGTSSPEPIRSE